MPSKQRAFRLVGIGGAALIGASLIGLVIYIVLSSTRLGTSKIDAGIQLIFEMQSPSRNGAGRMDGDQQPTPIAVLTEAVQKRVLVAAVEIPLIQSMGSNRILIQVPRTADIEQVKRLIGKTAKLTFHLVDETEVPRKGGRVPPGSMLLVGDSNPNQLYLIRKRVLLSGENLVDAQPVLQNGQPVVSIRFNSLGARKFGNLTRKYVGKPFAIVLDGKVISAPVIREPILGGVAIVSGRFTVKSAIELALLLRAGALPARLRLILERRAGSIDVTKAVKYGGPVLEVRLRRTVKIERLIRELRSLGLDQASVQRLGGPGRVLIRLMRRTTANRTAKLVAKVTERIKLLADQVTVTHLGPNRGI